MCLLDEGAHVALQLLDATHDLVDRRLGLELALLARDTPLVQQLSRVPRHQHPPDGGEDVVGHRRNLLDPPLMEVPLVFVDPRLELLHDVDPRGVGAEDPVGVRAHDCLESHRGVEDVSELNREAGHLGVPLLAVLQQRPDRDFSGPFHARFELVRRRQLGFVGGVVHEHLEGGRALLLVLQQNEMLQVPHLFGVEIFRAVLVQQVIELGGVLHRVRVQLLEAGVVRHAGGRLIDSVLTVAPPRNEPTMRRRHEIEADADRGAFLDGFVVRHLQPQRPSDNDGVVVFWRILLLLLIARLSWGALVLEHLGLIKDDNAALVVHPAHLQKRPTLLILGEARREVAERAHVQLNAEGERLVLPLKVCGGLRGRRGSRFRRARHLGGLGRLEGE
mmetsp:Transcript_52120/g.124150  ORF Transcript_52120/g.124150 Transcript_52120/m.124150 type:complete len:390 (-) Transcript_52120:1021-2190(-)